jgi:7-carboxy-7-deazaguanine synthase
MFIKDIFYSFQGEGPWVGYPQIFLRFYGCNITCDYCDEPDFVKDKKKYSIEDCVAELKSFTNKDVHSLSLTGGEPLMYADFIKQLAPHLDMPLYLETNATLPKNLAKIKDDITYFSIDYKPGYETPFKESLELLKDKEHVFIKYILCKDFPDKDIETVSELLKPYSFPFVIQPVTPFALVTEKASPEDIYRGYALAKKSISDVRVIPQTHKFINLK